MHQLNLRSKSVLGIQGRKSLPSYTEEDRIGSGPPEDERVTTKASGPKVGEINQASAPVTNSTPIYTTTTTRKTTTKADPQTPSEKTTVTTTVNTSTVKAGITTTTATTTTTTTPVINSEDVLEYAFDHTSEQPEPVRKIEDWTNEEMPKRAHNIVGPLVAQFIRYYLISKLLLMYQNSHPHVRSKIGAGTRNLFRVFSFSHRISST